MNIDQGMFFQTGPSNPMAAPPPHPPRLEKKKKKKRLGENLKQESIGYTDPAPESAHLFPWFAALRRIYLSKPSTVQGFEDSNLESPKMTSNHFNALSTSSLSRSNQNMC